MLKGQSVVAGLSFASYPYNLDLTNRIISAIITSDQLKGDA